MRTVQIVSLVCSSENDESNVFQMDLFARTRDFRETSHEHDPVVVRVVVLRGMPVRGDQHPRAQPRGSQ